jgi:hypothetical protein
VRGFLEHLFLPQARRVVKMGEHAEDHFSLRSLATSNSNCAKSNPQRFAAGSFQDEKPKNSPVLPAFKNVMQSNVARICTSDPSNK